MRKKKIPPRSSTGLIFFAAQILFLDEFAIADLIIRAVYVEGRGGETLQRECACGRADFERYSIRRLVVSRRPIAADLQKVVVLKAADNVFACSVDEQISTRAANQRIVTEATPQRVVAVLSVEFIVAGAAVNVVVAVFAVKRIFAAPAVNYVVLRVSD